MLPANYHESRKRFRELAKGLGAQVHAYYHDDNEDRHVTHRLSTDVVRLGPADAATLVVIASGTHGVEGYAGAACQFRFMEAYHQRHAAPGLAYLLVHAVNPWGFHHDRRVTREGVDLNRNFVDFPLPKSAFPSRYAAYHDLLVGHYAPLPSGWWNEMKLYSLALTAARRRRLQEAITGGQYDCPDGLFYGGAGPVQSRLVWERLLREQMGRHERVALLDLHTGLGPSGVGELISYLPASDPSFRRMSAWFGGGLKSMLAGQSVSAAVTGTLTAAFDRTMPCTSYAIGLEFGTLPPLAVLNAMREDQWARGSLAAPRSPQAVAQARRVMRQAFMVRDPAWEHRVLTRFSEVVRALTAGLAGDAVASATLPPVEAS